MTAVLYVHGKGGDAGEAARYEPLFPSCAVVGLDHRADTPWEAGAEIRAAVSALKARYDRVLLIANSIGAFFSMHADIEADVAHAFFISPVVDMERLILDLMGWAGVTEETLRERGTIPTAFGEDLSWEYLSYVRSHPVRWDVPTDILYGSADTLTPRDAVEAFAAAHHARLAVMDGGEHWFHTEEQLRFLDDWIKTAIIRRNAF